MTPAVATPPTVAPVERAAPLDPRAGRLAVIFQELLTTVVRLRAGRQVAADAESFRAHVRQMLAVANEEAQRAGHTPEDVRVAMYAVVAFLDESVLNSTAPMFIDWPRKPLQDELFGGGHRGGELFFQYLDHLMSRQDSAHLADLLEVFLTCLLLGFHGRYSAGEDDERQLVTSRVLERVRRIRGGSAALPSLWAEPQAPVVGRPADPWIRRLAMAAGASFAVALLLWGVFSLALGSGADELRELVTPPATSSP